MKATLIAWTQRPVETIYSIWESSCSTATSNVLDPAVLETVAASRSSLREDMEALFIRVIDSGIPVAENLSFTFLLDDVSVAFREQLVRHRIGVKVGELLGVDLVPGLTDSTWWAQSMRVLDMSQFEYEVPKTIAADLPVRRIYEQTMKAIRLGYQSMINAGVPAEDARMLLPLATTHRISWTLNLAALKHVIGKRGCWILQAGFWEPFIEGAVEELCEKVHPAFRRLIEPPCIKEGEFRECLFELDNKQRLAGKDPLPPCSLYLGKVTGLDAPDETELERKWPRFLPMVRQYSRLWNRNAYTGEALVPKPAVPKEAHDPKG